MGSFKKKILINKVKLIDKARMASGEIAPNRPFKTSEIHRALKDERRSSYIAVDELKKLVDIARAHALWLHMMMLKEAFRFTGKQLSEYREKLRDVYKYAFDDASVKTPVEDIVAVTVKGSPKDDEGSFGYTDYQQEPFDAVFQENQWQECLSRPAWVQEVQAHIPRVSKNRGSFYAGAS